MDIDNPKIPPNSIDSEQSVLGGLLLHNESWDNVVNILSSDDFYQTSHRIIYDAIVILLEHDKPADILTVKEQVIKTHDEDSIGGFAYLAQIAENTPSVSNIEAYAKHVRELSIYRQLIKIGKEMADTAFSPKDIEVNDLLDLSERKVQLHPCAIRPRPGLGGRRCVARARRQARRRRHLPVCENPYRHCPLPVQQHALGQRHLALAQNAGCRRAHRFGRGRQRQQRRSTLAE